MRDEKTLYEYIKRDFYRSNQSRYYKYFDDWYNNLTPNQILFWWKRFDGQIC